MDDTIGGSGILSEHIEFALDATNSIIWAVDLNTGETEAVIGAVESLFNVEAEEVASAEAFFETVVHPEDLHEVEQVYTDVARGQIEVFEVEFRTHPATGSIRWINSHGRIQKRPDTQLLVGILTDITEQKRHEQELEQQNDRLEEVISVVSHDLRNPLSVAQGRLELAQTDCESEHLDRVAGAHERMEMLIENLLTSAEKGTPLTRGGGESQSADTVAVASLVESCWQNVATEEATLIPEIDQQIAADRSRLQQLFENLIRNAVEHGGSDVTVTAGSLDDEVGFYIADDGPGIPESDRVNIFARGYSGAEGGTGLGLHIVKQVVEAHNWSITVTDSEDGGARFEISGIEKSSTDG